MRSHKIRGSGDENARIIALLDFISSVQYNTPPWQTHRVFGRNVTRSANFPSPCRFVLCHCFSFFKHTQVIHAGYVKVAPGKPKAGWVKQKNFTLWRGKNPLGRVLLGLLQRGVIWFISSIWLLLTRYASGPSVWRHGWRLPALPTRETSGFWYF